MRARQHSSSPTMSPGSTSGPSTPYAQSVSSQNPKSASGPSSAGYPNKRELFSSSERAASTLPEFQELAPLRYAKGTAYASFPRARQAMAPTFTRSRAACYKALSMRARGFGPLHCVISSLTGRLIQLLPMPEKPVWQSQWRSYYPSRKFTCILIFRPLSPQKALTDASWQGAPRQLSLPRRVFRCAGHLEQFPIIQPDRTEFTAPQAAAIKRDKSLAHNQAKRRPMPDDQTILGTLS